MMLNSSPFQQGTSNSMNNSTTNSVNNQGNVSSANISSPQDSDVAFSKVSFQLFIIIQSLLLSFFPNITEYG